MRLRLVLALLLMLPAAGMAQDTPAPPDPDDTPRFAGELEVVGVTLPTAGLRRLIDGDRGGEMRRAEIAAR